MKRDATTLGDIADWEWLCECAARAAKAKRNRSSVQCFFNDFDANINLVQGALLRASLPKEGYRCFTITDPKPRLIHAAPFADRVAHHAIIGKLANRFELAQVPSSYACRPGKGVHAAICHARRVAQRSPWLLKMDVHSYFAHIDHAILKQLLAKLFKDDGTLGLLHRIIDGYSTGRGRGLPIGALTSQYFANHYLDGIQRYLREQTKTIDELRYMDDLWIGCPTKAAAMEIADASRRWLKAERKLAVKPVFIQRSSVGLPFCGFTISSRRLVPGKRRRRAVAKHYAKLADACHHGDITELECQATISSTAALLRPGVHVKLSRKLIANSRINTLC